MKKDTTTKTLSGKAADRRKFLKTTAAVGGAPCPWAEHGAEKAIL